MKRDRYLCFDVHQATTAAALMKAEGKIVLETPLATEVAPIRGGRNF